MLNSITNRLPVLLKSVTDRKLDAPEQLTQEHMKVESLLLQLKMISQVAKRMPSRKEDLRGRRDQLFTQIRESLEAHMKAEEEVFYPECEKVEELQDQVKDSYEEHKALKDILKKMSDCGGDDAGFDACLGELVKNINHHVNDEEKKMFPMVRKTMSRTRLERVGGQLRSIEQKSKDEAAA